MVTCGMRSSMELMRWHSAWDRVLRRAALFRTGASTRNLDTCRGCDVSRVTCHDTNLNISVVLSTAANLTFQSSWLKSSSSMRQKMSRMSRTIFIIAQQCRRQ